MKSAKRCKILRVYVGEEKLHKGRRLYEDITLKARELKIRGATVFRGIMGYGTSSRLHTSKLLRLSDDMPVVIEIIDCEESLGPLLEYIDDVMHDGVVTIQDIDVVGYRHGSVDDAV